MCGLQIDCEARVSAISTILLHSPWNMKSVDNQWSILGSIDWGSERWGDLGVRRGVCCEMRNTNNIDCIGFLWGLNELICVTHMFTLALRGKKSINRSYCCTYQIAMVYRLCLRISPRFCTNGLLWWKLLHLCQPQFLHKNVVKFVHRPSVVLYIFQNECRHETVLWYLHNVANQ